MPSFETTQLFLMGGSAVNALLALAVWTLLREPRQAATARLWTAGALLASMATVVSALRFDLPVWLVAGVAPTLALLSLGLRILALRQHLALPLRLDLACGVALPGGLVYALTQTTSDLRLGTSVLALAFALATAGFAWHAHLSHRRTGSPSARFLAWAEWPMVAMWSARAVMVWVAETPGMPQSGVVSVHYVALILVVAVAAIYGNLGYLGMVLDDTLHAEAQAREGQVAEAASRRTAERNAEALRQLLAQRDHLAKGRQRMLTMLAHEIRQPLHNASGALQATDTALQGLPGDQARQAIERLRRAQAVLGGVHSILDNTLAANTLLADSAPIGLQEVEVGYLVDLTLGDLTEAQRARVVVQCPADLHSLEVEPGLMRLALRNLLSNALTHGGPAARVTLRIEECDTPPTLLLSVIDDGPGAASDRLMPSEAGDTPGLPSGRGLGLMIVREVAGRHGGQLVFKPMSPRGLCASVVLPLPG